MAAMTNEQIEQKKQLLAEKMKEVKALYDELVEAGAIEIPEEALGEVDGGIQATIVTGEGSHEWGQKNVIVPKKPQHHYL